MSSACTMSGGGFVTVDIPLDAGVVVSAWLGSR